MGHGTGAEHEKLENGVGGSKMGLTKLRTSSYLEGNNWGWMGGAI